MRSLKTKLLIGCIAGVAAALLVLGVSLYAMARTSLMREYQRSLFTQAHAIASMAERRGSRISVEMTRRDMPAFVRRNQPDYYQIWFNGHVAVRSATLRRARLPRLRPGKDGTCRAVRLPDGQPGMEAVITAAPRADGASEPGPVGEIVVATAGHLRPVQETLARLRLWIVILCLAGLLVSAALVTITIQQAMRPMRQIAARIATIGSSNLSDRVDTGQTPAELLPVVRRLNDLLGRLDETVQREKAFTAEVAHELRTPLAGLQTTLEVCMARPRKPAEYQDAIETCLQMIARMHAMVANLLNMARADAGHLHVQILPTPVDDMVHECWEPFAVRARQRKLNVDFSLTPGLVVKTDREKSRLVLNNLFDNATCYAQAGGNVRVESRRQDAVTTLRVTNTAEGAAAVGGDFFNRFWRGDEARAADGMHCGLGLTLARKVMQALHGDVEAHVSGAGEFVAEVIFRDS